MSKETTIARILRSMGLPPMHNDIDDGARFIALLETAGLKIVKKGRFTGWVRDQKYIVSASNAPERVICTDVPGKYPVMTMDVSGNVSRWTIEGHYEHSTDVKLIPPAPELPGEVVWRCQDYRQADASYFVEKPSGGWTTIERGLWMPDPELKVEQ